jgi:hypothetical protein
MRAARNLGIPRPRSPVLRGRTVPGVRRCNLTLPADDPSDCSLAATSLRSHQPQRCSRAREPALRGHRHRQRTERCQTSSRMRPVPACQRVGVLHTASRPARSLMGDGLASATAPSEPRRSTTPRPGRSCGAHPGQAVTRRAGGQGHEPPDPASRQLRRRARPPTGLTGTRRRAAARLRVG